MSCLRSQTLIRYTSASFFSRTRTVRRLSTLPESSLEAESEAKAVETIDDVIHSFIVRGHRPDWLTFVPGSSYWVPPPRTSYGVAGIMDTLANTLTEEEHMSLTTIQGWPSSSFYVHNETSSPHFELPRFENDTSPAARSQEDMDEADAE